MRNYRIGSAILDTSLNCLRRNGEEQRLRHKTFQTLLYLVERRDRVVTKDELLVNVWKDAAVTEDTLVQSISEIRKALGDDAQTPQFVKTVPKVGYRLVAPVETIDEELAAAPEPPPPDVLLPDAPLARTRRTWLRAVTGLIAAGVVGSTLFAFKDQLFGRPDPVPAARTVAVVPFSNRSGDPSLDWLREGLPDMLIAGLARSRNLTVISRAQLHALTERVRPDISAIDLPTALQIARASRADVVVVGAFARLGTAIRLDVHLHDVQSGSLMSAQSLSVDAVERLLSDVDLLSIRVAHALGAPTVRAERQPTVSDMMTDNLEAYRAYSLAIEQANAYHTDEAVQLLERAIALDPRFAMAYARIGYIYGVVRNNEGQRARPYLEKAFKFSDRLSEKDKQFITAWYAISHNDHEGAVRALRRITAEYPEDTEAYWRLGDQLTYAGRSSEAVEVYERGLAIDPGAKQIWNTVGFAYSGLGQYDRAIAAHERYAALDPQEPNAHDSLGMTYDQAGRRAEALAEFDRALALKPEFHFAVLHKGDVFVQLGRYRDALKQYERYIEIAPSNWDRAAGCNHIALVYLRLRDFARAERAAIREREFKNNFGTAWRVALESGDLRRAKVLADEFEPPGFTKRDYGFLQGLMALRTGRSDEALGHFKKMLAIPAIVWGVNSVEDAVASTYVELGRLDEAVAEYRRILQLSPHEALIHYRLATILDKQGKSAQARESYARFLQLWKDADPDIPEVRAAKARLAAIVSTS